MWFHGIFFFSVPTALKGTVSHNAPIVHVEKEIHTVNQPVHVEKPYNVPYDVIKHVEKIIEVPTPVHVGVPVPYEVPHPVLGKNYFLVLKLSNCCLDTLGVQVRNMKMVFNISTLSVGSGNQH